MNKEHLHNWMNTRKEKSKLYDFSLLFEEIKKGDVAALSRGITLIESKKTENRVGANSLIRLALPFSGNSLRIGITGVPGVGKSTFIESFGLEWIKKGKKVAVLAIDPSSERNHGSILGDKTRMEKLSIHPSAFIRPTASDKSLGGVARNTREAIILCELAGYEVIIIETVGVGQSETQVHSMVDFFILLMLAGAGDELQGIKRGIMEMADLLVITKADGENIRQAKVAQQLYQSALHLFPINSNNWNPKVERCSSFNTNEVANIVRIAENYELQMSASNYKQMNRKNQDLYWFQETTHQLILHHFFNNNNVNVKIDKLKKDILTGKVSSFEAADELFKLYANGEH